MSDPRTAPAGGASTADQRSLRELFDEYASSRRLGPPTRTIGNYRCAWGGFAAYLGATDGREAVASDLTVSNLTDYLAEQLADGRWGEQSARTYAGNIRSVVSGMQRLGLLSPDVLARFERPAVEERAPLQFDDLELTLIFDHLEAAKTTVNLRLRTVIQLMLDCGARPEELSALRFVDLDEARSQLHLDGKGAKKRTVPLGGFSWRYLDDYMRVRPEPSFPTDPVFVAARGEPTAISPSALASDMREVLIAVRLIRDTAASKQNASKQNASRQNAGEKSGKEQSGKEQSGKEENAGYRLYTMRKTFARRAAEGGMDVAELAAIMGHEPSSIPMLLHVYYRPSDKQKRDAHAAARPADSFHEWRATTPRLPVPPHPLTYFERISGGSSTLNGKTAARDPASRSRTSGEYRRTSRTKSEWLTGA